MTRQPVLGTPPTLREILCGTTPYGGSAYRDLYAHLAHTWPNLMLGDRKALWEDLGNSWPMVEILDGLWTAAARVLDRKGSNAGPDPEVFQEQLSHSWGELGRLLDGRPADDVELERLYNLPSPLDELHDRQTTLLSMLGNRAAHQMMPDVVWRYARRAKPDAGLLQLYATAFGITHDECSFAPRHIPGTRLLDVLGHWRETGMQAIADAALLARGQIRDAVAEAVAERTAPARPEPVATIARIRREAAEAEAEQSAPEPEAGPGVVVVPRIGGGAKGQSNTDAAKDLGGILGRRLPRYEFPSDRHALVEEAAAEAPHARRFFERLVALQDTREHWALPPILALGDPGGGKTTAVDAFFRRHGLHVERYACDGSADNAAAGTPRRWASGEVSLPLRASMTAGYANPVILWDEVNRAGGQRQGSGGTLRDALTSFLEPANSARYRDPYVEAEVDISHVLHVATANNLYGIAPQVLDRLVVLEFPLPTREHLTVLARRMAAEIARRQGLPDDHGELDRAELQALAENWPGGSLRGLRRLVEVAMQVRLQAPWATRH
ncbi:AAA family ATPase [Methylobacterium sp. NPDC080182]|uniref:AAA family ATPase n=1 Tax=Methylobacterium sp. NPDC080182 TaxID=3390590 RepID=UPI003CFF95A9